MPLQACTCRSNCFNRAIALERRLAGSPTSAIGGEEVRLSAAYDDYLREVYPSGTTAEFMSRGPMEDIFLVLGEGTRGVVFGLRATETGHAFNAMVSNGRVVFMTGPSTATT